MWLDSKPTVRALAALFAAVGLVLAGTVVVIVVNFVKANF